jgi:hypothetical protein
MQKCYSILELALHEGTGEGGIRTLGTTEHLRPDRSTYETEHA